MDGRRPGIARRDTGPPTQDVPQSPASLEAKIKALMDQYGAATRPRTEEVPRVDARPPIASDVEWSKNNPPATTQKAAPATMPVVEANVPAATRGAMATTVPVAILPELDAAVTARAAKDPRDVSAALDSQLLRFLRDQPVPDPAAIAGLPREDQDIVSAVMDALNNFRTTVRNDPNAMYQAKARALGTIGERLRVGADLSIPVISLASVVRGFGNYEPMQPIINAAGNSERVVYFEVKDFSSNLVQNGMWETRLSAALSIFDSHGQVVWALPAQEYRDLCRNRRSDFFICPKVKLRAMPAGKYTLKVSLTDLNRGRVAEGMLKLDSVER